MKFFPLLFVLSFLSLILYKNTTVKSDNKGEIRFKIKGSVKCDFPDLCFGTKIALIQDGVELTHVQIGDTNDFEIRRTLKFESRFKLKYTSATYPDAEYEYDAIPDNPNSSDVQEMSVKTLVWRGKTIKFLDNAKP